MDTPDVWDIQVRSYTSFAALVFLIWENLTTLDDEMNCIWRRPTTIMKKLYLFSRYLALVGQIINHLLILKLLSRYPLEASVCKGWYMYQGFVFFSLLMTVEIILMIRVYALYNRSLKVGVFMSLVLLAKHMLIVVCFARVLGTVPEPFDSACLVHETPRETMYFGGAAIAVQVIIWAMTMYKRTVAVRYGWGRTPLVSLVVRDGTLVFVSATMLFVSTSMYGFLADSITNTAFPPFISALSITACRLTISMQRVAIRQPMDTTPDIEFTTVPPESEPAMESIVP